MMLAASIGMHISSGTEIMIWLFLGVFILANLFAILTK
jgi:hypothetical protein